MPIKISDLTHGFYIIPSPEQDQDLFQAVIFSANGTTLDISKDIITFHDEQLTARFSALMERDQNLETKDRILLLPHSEVTFSVHVPRNKSHTSVALTEQIRHQVRAQHGAARCDDINFNRV